MLHLPQTLARWRRNALAALALAGVSLLAQAASVQEQADVLRRPDAAAATAGGKTLDRALSVDSHIDQRNLDLLLETRSAGDGPGDAAPRRATALPPAARAAASAAPGVGLPTALPGSALPDSPDQPGMAAQREWLGAAPGAGSDNPGLLANSGLPMTAGVDLGPHRSGNDAAREIDPALRSAVVRDMVVFLRENRIWLLGALAGVAAVVVGVQAWLRRAGDTPESRAERLSTQLGQPRGERRTRRRSTRRA